MRRWMRRLLLVLGLVLLGSGGLLLWLGEGSPRVGWARVRLWYPPSWRVRDAAAGELADWGEDAVPAVGSLAARLRDEHPTVRYKAAMTLGRLGPLAKPAVGDLRESLGDPEAFVRREAAIAIGRVDPTSTAGVPVLAALLAEGDSWAGRALVELGPRAAEAVPQVTAGLEDEDGASWAAVVLGAIGRDAAPAVPALVQALRVPRGGDPVPYLDALGQIGVATPEAVSSVARALEESDDPQVRDAATVALERFGPPARAAIPSLVRAYEEADPEARASVAAALGSVDPRDAGGILPSVIRLFEQGQVAEGARILSAVGPAGAAAVPQLIQALDDPKAFLHAAIALGKIGTPEALEALRGLRDDPVELRRALSVFALGYAAPTSHAVAQELVTILENGSEVDAGYAAYGLGNMGAAASFALPSLERAAARGLGQASVALEKIRSPR